tara:strand:- start:193 stop:558 length:366 start_codon:yes stop_codon:yes gene_type:complete
MAQLINGKFFSISNSSSNPTSLLSPLFENLFLLTDILICNTNSSDATASIFIREQDSSNTAASRNDISIVKNVLVPGNTSIEIIDGSYPIYYRKGEPYYDHVMAFASTTGIDIIMGYQKIS